MLFYNSMQIIKRQAELHLLILQCHIKLSFITYRNMQRHLNIEYFNSPGTKLNLSLKILKILPTPAIKKI